MKRNLMIYDHNKDEMREAKTVDEIVFAQRFEQELERIFNEPVKTNPKKEGPDAVCQ